MNSHQTAAQILGEASDTISDRHAVYGPAKEGMSRVAEMWSVHLGMQVQPHDVPVMLTLLKIARAGETPDHQDNYLDGAAYMAIAGECANG